MSDKGLQTVIEEVTGKFGNAQFGAELRALIQRSFTDDQPYAACMQRFVIELFRDTPLIVLNMDDARLKRQFIPVIREELTDQTSRKLIEKSQGSVVASWL